MNILFDQTCLTNKINQNYMKVVKHQLHTCSPQQCGGPAPLGQQCKRGFPRPYSPVPDYKSEQLRYVYRRIAAVCNPSDPADPAFLINDGHISARYVASRSLVDDHAT